MTSTPSSSCTVTAALTIAEQDIFATSAEWDTPQSHATESIRHESSTSATEAAQQQSESESESESASQSVDDDAEHNISQGRRFQKFLRRFGGNRKSRS